MMDLVERSLQHTVIIRGIKFYCNSDKSSAKSKHIDFKFVAIKAKVQNQLCLLIVSVLFFNITDPLMKRLSPKVFLEHIAHMGMASYDDILV